MKIRSAGFYTPGCDEWEERDATPWEVRLYNEREALHARMRRDMYYRLHPPRRQGTWDDNPDLIPGETSHREICECGRKRALYNGAKLINSAAEGKGNPNDNII